MKIKAEEIDTLPPGSVIRANGNDWVRITDWSDRHIRGYLCHIDSGNWIGWQSLFLSQDEVELVKRGEH